MIQLREWEEKRKRLKAVLDKHRLFRDGRMGGARANLSYTDLSGLNLSRCDLSHADFTGAVLSHAKFEAANLEGAILTDAILDGAEFAGATMPDGTPYRDPKAELVVLPVAKDAA